MLCAVIQNGVVENVILTQESFVIAGKTLVECDNTVSRGDTFDGNSFSRPTPIQVPKTQFAPFDFLGLFTSVELVQILSSTDPVVMVAVAHVQTIITVVNLTAPETIQLIGYFATVGLLTSDRAAQVLAGEAP